MLMLGIALAVWIPIALSPWLITRPWRWIKRIGRTGRDSGSIPFRT